MFISPEEWLEHYESCVRDGRRAWEPATRDELKLAESLGILAIHPEWVPCRAWLRVLELPTWFGRRQESLSPLWQERFVQTLIDNPGTAAAVRAILLGGQTNDRN
jgi:hypothetical protein